MSNRYRLVTPEQAVNGGYLEAAFLYDPEHMERASFNVLVDTVNHAVVTDDNFDDCPEDATLSRGYYELVRELNRLASIIELWEGNADKA